MTRRLLLLALFLAPPILVVGALFAARQHVILTAPARLSAAARAAAVVPLRAGLLGQPIERPQHAELGLPLPGAGIVAVSVWVDGRRAVRVEGRGAVLAEALVDGARVLAASPALAKVPRDRLADARLQVDVVAAHAPLLTRWQATTQLGVIAGMDGVGVRVGAHEVVVLPDEIVAERLLDAATPIPMVNEFRIGLEFDKVEALLAKRADLGPGVFGGAPDKRYFRLRTDSFVERPINERGPGDAGAPVALTRGWPPGPELSAAALRRAAELGGQYLMAHLTPQGRYIYEVDLTSGRASDPRAGSYSLPRHAGTSYYLAELYEVTKDPALRAKLELALDHVVALIRLSSCKGTSRSGKTTACLADRGARTTNMGSTALAVVAFAEYRLVTGDPRYDDILRELAEWILDLEKPRGGFAHMYDIAKQLPDWQTELLYFDGEAALALIRAFKVFKDERYLRAAERALDRNIRLYDNFVAQFFFSEEHWTCIAAEAAWPDLKHDRYREFCSDYGAFLRGQQFAAGENVVQPDLDGSYSVTPFFVPHNTPVGSRSEAMISAYLLTRHHGKPDPALRRQVLAAVGYLLGQQIRPEGDWFTPAPDAVGAVPSSSVDRNVRIDFVQHTCSAMLRAIELLADEAGN